MADLQFAIDLQRGIPRESQAVLRKSQIQMCVVCRIRCRRNTEPEGVAMTTTHARPRPLPTAEAVHKAEPIRAKPQAPSSSASAPSQKKFSKEKGPKPEPKILFQRYFKSVGPRTYAAQVKEAGNGNHFLVLTEGKRDDKTGDLRKTSLLVFSEDFSAFFELVQQAQQFIAANPVPEEVRKKREEFWAKQQRRSKSD
jgi:hypothetical protein